MDYDALGGQISKQSNPKRIGTACHDDVSDIWVIDII